MKIESLAGIVVLAVLGSGCVTEGLNSVEPASAQEQAEVNLALGVGYVQEGRPDLAIEPLLRAAEAQPRSVDVHRTLAVAYDQAGDPDRAEVHHERAADLAPRNADAQNGYAVFLCRQNRWLDAEPYFSRAIAVSGDLAAQTAMTNAARCARGAGELEAAGTYFRAVLNLDPVNPEALRGMMDVSIRTANYNSGRAFWQRLESTTTLLPSDLLSCYVIEAGLSDSVAAQNCANRLRQDFPGAPETLQLRELERNAG